MKYSFHPSAKIELDQAADYYESCEPGLGIQFADEVYVAIQRIIAFPTAWSSLSSRTRACLTNRFPYRIIYQIAPNNIRIVALAHLSRRPGYWNDRLGEVNDY